LKCGKLVTTTNLRRVDRDAFRREISHLDGSPPCVVEAEEPSASRPKSTVFLCLEDAATWAPHVQRCSESNASCIKNATVAAKRGVARSA
jgi:hypothetical protein